MINDPIVEEIRIFRAAHAAKYGNDLDRIFLAIKKVKNNMHMKLVNHEVKCVLQEEKI